jgi:formylglycine-generating enzyme required for sulfatase activity
MSDIFLSYAREDEERVKPIVEHLEAQGWSVFWDQHIPPGKTFRQHIKENLDAARCVVVVWSQHSIDSHWVLEEAETGRKRTILVPLRIDQVEPPFGFGSIQAADLTSWNHDASHLQFRMCVGAISTVVPQPDLAKEPSPKISVTSVEPPVFKPQLPENFVLIKGETFIMGSPKGEYGREPNETLHEVKLSDFAMCRYAVTQEEWRMVTGSNPSKFKGDNLPVERVSWDDCQDFIKRLNQKTGQIYRLSTEAEWEYACRAGTTTPFNTGENLTTDQANYDGNEPYRNYPKGEYRQKTVPVDHFVPNGYGLYNMHGNVWEWCSDLYGGYGMGTVENPSGPTTGSYRVFRGGGLADDARVCRSARRGYSFLGTRSGGVGFRLVFVPQL